MAQRPRFPYKRFALPNLGQRKQNVSWMVFRRGLHPMPPERSKPHWPTSDDDGANSGGANSDDDSSGGANSGGASNGDGDARRDPWCAFHLRSPSSSRRCKTRRPTIGLVCISWDGWKRILARNTQTTLLRPFPISDNLQIFNPAGFDSEAGRRLPSKRDRISRIAHRVSIGPSNSGPPAATKPSLVPWSFGLTQKA